MMNIRLLCISILVTAFPALGHAQEYTPPEWTTRLSAQLQVGGMPLLVRALHNNRSSGATADWIQLRFGDGDSAIGLLVPPTTALDIHELLWLHRHGAVTSADGITPATVVARVHMDGRRTLTFVCEDASLCGEPAPVARMVDLSSDEANVLNVTLLAMAAELGVRRETAPVAPAVAAAATVPPDTGRITVRAQPAGTLYIDGEPVGETPVSELAVTIGEHELRVERDGYEAVVDTIAVRGTGTLRRTYRLRITEAQEVLEEGGGRLTVRSQPVAMLVVDGQMIGETPLVDLALASGAHVIRVEREGFVSVTDTILILGGTALRRSYQLLNAAEIARPAVAPAAPSQAPPMEPGSLTITSTPAASVFVDGRHVGDTPIIAHRVGQGVHIVELVKDGFLPLADTVHVDPGARVRKEYRLKAKNQDARR